MSKTKIGCLSVFIVMLILFASVWTLIQITGIRIPRFPSKKKGDLHQAQVLLGTELIVRSKLWQEEGMGEISSLYIEYNPHNKIGIIGETGVAFIKDTGEVKESIQFAPLVEKFWFLKYQSRNRIGKIQVLPTAESSTYEFLVRNNFFTAELIDNSGKSVWLNDDGKRNHVHLMDMVAGDINGDGKYEFVTAYLNGKGLVLLDENLQEVWSKPEVYAKRVELEDINHDGKLDIVHDASDCIVVRDINGNEISKASIGHYIEDFSLIHWPNKSGPVYVVHYADQSIRLLNFAGKIITEYSAPFKEGDQIRVATVKLKPDQPEFFAAIINSGVLEQSVLYIYDSTGALVYQEISSEQYRSISTLPDDQTGGETILVGGENTVWQYKLATTTKLSIR